MSRAITRELSPSKPEITLPSAELPTPASARLDRARVHAFAWWAWAICGMAVLTISHNPLLIVTVIAAVVFVVVQRRSDDPWARSLRFYFGAAVVVLAIRLFFQILVGASISNGPVLIELPEIQLPEWMAGIRLGGPVTLDGLLFTLYDAGRLAGLLICVGAANALANPKRALRSMPAAFHQISTAIVIGLSLLPQLIESGRRISKARQLRGTPSKSFRGMTSLLVPVLADAVDRSIALAASMESRGYGARADSAPTSAHAQNALVISGSLALLFGTFALLSLPDAWPAALLIALGVLLGGLGLRTAGRRLAVTKFEPDPWRGIEWAVLACGLAAVILTVYLNAVDPAMHTPSSPPTWPQLSAPMLGVVALLAAPGIFTPAPSRLPVKRTGDA